MPSPPCITEDSDLAKRVIDGDKQVNMMEVAIDEACVRIIAKRQPTASDLRLGDGDHQDYR